MGNQIGNREFANLGSSETVACKVPARFLGGLGRLMYKRIFVFSENGHNR